ncbi:MAG: hypothetical protein WDW36_007595 [Sanguina aurantia]
MVFSCLLPTLSMVFLFMTACRDPGIIARQDPDQEYLEGRKPRTKEVLVNNQRIVLRYNDTCHIYQPPRAHHCSVNDNCVERFDHHCPWVGTTIGKRNYRSFLLFIYTAAVLCLYVIGCCLAQLFVWHSQVVEAAQASGDGSSPAMLWLRTVGGVIPALVVAGYCFVFFWFVGGLSLFHAYLISTNQTTYENFRYNHDSRVNPYDRGCLMNCFEVWLTPTPPSQVNFMRYLDECAAPAPQPQPQPLGGALATFSAGRPVGDGGREHVGGRGHMYGNGDHQFGGHSGISASQVGPMERGSQALGECVEVEVAPTPLHPQAVHMHRGSSEGCNSATRDARSSHHHHHRAGLGPPTHTAQGVWGHRSSSASPAQLVTIPHSLQPPVAASVDSSSLQQPRRCGGGSETVTQPQPLLLPMTVGESLGSV